MQSVFKSKIRHQFNSDMYSLINTNFCKTYNPNGRQNALSDIKRLLTSRDTVAQKKACGYLIEVISRYKDNTNERHRMVEYLLDYDITVFLCEATSNLDLELFRSVLHCLRLIWRSRRFFSEEHAAHSMTAVVRALSHYASTGLKSAVDACLHFLDDLLNGITTHKTSAPLSHQSAYSAAQLLACLNVLPTHLNANPAGMLSSALVLLALISYQPENLSIKGTMATALLDVLKKWLVILMGSLNHSMLVDNSLSGMFYVVLCQIGMTVLRLIKLLNKTERSDFVQSILNDEQEINVLKQCAAEMAASLQLVLSELVVFTKEHQTQLSTEEYSVFLKLLLNFLYDNANTDTIRDFCDVLFNKGYIIMLPQAQLIRNDTSVRKASTLVLGEMLKVLADKYLSVDSCDSQADACAKHIQMGLVELQSGIEEPQSLGVHLQKAQPYSLLVYVYFYCQSSENPEEATAPLLPYLVDHILRLPSSFVPPPYVIKALWLVFAMSSISNGSLQSLDERVYLEKATDRLVAMLHPRPSIYYTHNPALLLWAFTSERIPYYVRLHVLSQWLKSEDTIPTDLTSEPSVWELLLNILVQTDNNTIATNCMEALQLCFDEGDEERKQEFCTLVWTMMPTVLSKALIDDCQIGPNICYFLDVATALLPNELDQTTCLKTAVLITAMFSKNDDSSDVDKTNHYKYVCLKLSLYLLGMANNQNDNRVLLTYTNRPGFLPSVLSATNSTDDSVACSALQLLSYIVHYFNRNKYQPKIILQIQTNLVIQSLHKDSSNERGASLLQLVYMVLNSGIHSPLMLAYDVGETPSVMSQGMALRALMLRIQLMLCRRDSENQTSAGWKTLSSILKHAIVSKNDTKLVAILTSQPWTLILIQFQLTQNITEEFLTFVHNWLTLLKITIKKSLEEKKMQMCRQSLVIKTLVIMKKNLVVEKDLEDANKKALVIVSDILDDSGIKT